MMTGVSYASALMIGLHTKHCLLLIDSLLVQCQPCLLVFAAEASQPCGRWRLAAHAVEIVHGPHMVGCVFPLERQE